MILNEDYFDDIEITDKDIESPENSAGTALKYDEPSEWFDNEINGKYSAVLYISMSTDNNYYSTLLNEYNKWKLFVPYIQKRLGYIFTEYGVEYYTPEQVILQDSIHLYKTGYKRCVFNDFHDYKIISEYYIDVVSQGYWFIYMPVFFNFPKTQSYRVVCKLISSIIKFLWEGKPADYLKRQEIVLTSQYSEHYIEKKKNRIININDIVNIIHLSLGIDRDIIKDKLYANNRELLCKIWKYFYPDLKYLRPKHPKWVDEINYWMT